MNIIINSSSMLPIYEQVAGQIISAVIDGSLKENDRLPSVRELSAKLRISALTVKKAYDTLEKDGYVVTVHGKGTYVAAYDPDLTLEARRREVEDIFAKAIDKAGALGMDKNDILDIINILLEE